MAEGEEIKPPPNLPEPNVRFDMGLEKANPPTSEEIEQMRFGLARSGPLTQAVLTNNGYAFADALPAGVLDAPTRCVSTDRPLNARVGQMIYEIDTTGMYVWDGSSWVSVGTPGAAATVYVGTTTTGVSGTNASVINSGTASSAVLDFTIPRGDTGATGATGPAGAAATISVSSTTTGASGTLASVSNVGSTSAAILNFTIPRGDKGDTGTAATVSAGTTTTLTPGSSATVVNSGTSSAAVFDFGIPAGSAATITVSSTTTVSAGTPASVSNVGTSSAAVLTFQIPQGAAGVGTPTGSILAYGGKTLPSADWLWCDGSQVSQATYATLYGVLGANRYGTDTGGNFYLPDLKARFPRGASAVTAAVTTTNTNAHTHNQSSSTANQATTNAANTDLTHGHSFALTPSGTVNTGGDNHTHSFGVDGGHAHTGVTRAAGNLAAATTSTQGAHNHGFVSNNHSHNATFTGSSTGTVNTNNSLTNHSHTITNGAITITNGAIASSDHIPAYVEVNYIIKT